MYDYGKGHQPQKINTAKFFKTKLKHSRCTVHTHIHTCIYIRVRRCSNFLVGAISAGLASAHPNYYMWS